MKIIMIDSLVNNDYSFWLCRGLSQAGHDVEIICTENRKNMKESFTVLPVSPEKGSGKTLAKLLKYLYFLFWLFFYLWRRKPAIVHYQFFRHERIECLYFPLLRLVHPHLIFTAHNILPHENKAIDHYLRYLVYKSASKIIVHSPGAKNRLLKLFPVPEGKMAVIPAVKPAIGKSNLSINKEIARQHLGLASNDKVLLFFGFIRKYKGLERLLTAFDTARASDECLKLLVAGEAQTKELLVQYQTQINAMHFGNCVSFRAEYIPEDELDYYFCAADALALPYSQIDFSGVLQVAFAYGLPVLATNVGNFADWIEQGVNGYISHENTAEEFTNIIKLAFQDMNALARMGQAALKIDCEYPGWVEIALLNAELYQQELHVSSV